MQDNLPQTTFGRHESFPLRFGWLPKGFLQLQNDAQLFKQESAVVKLGVGKNMVNAIRYWLRVTRLVREQGSGVFIPTALGEAILGKYGDPYLEDEATLWILHWLIGSNATLATGFYWFFNHYAVPDFSETELLASLQRFLEPQVKSDSSLKSDLSCLLRMYSRSAKLNAAQAEDGLDSPLSLLELIQPLPGRRFQSQRGWREELPTIALAFAILDRFEQQPQQPAVPVQELLYGGGGGGGGGGSAVAPGAVFRLNEEGFSYHLEQALQHYLPDFEQRDTAGLHQLYRRQQTQQSLTLLQDHYH
ncbi:DUF4007 family protein [Ectothiorhodospiraceae bacterium BW-2]|nr:DUF4007 family protein [Ectothiorhodospiraceae bacterium BW-2]